MTKLYRDSKLIQAAVIEPRGIIGRAKGLLGRKHVETDFFMLLKDCNSVHTFFMSTAIDVIMTDRHGVVTRVWEGLKPWRMAVCLKAADTLETGAGGAGRYGIKTGDVITFS